MTWVSVQPNRRYGQFLLAAITVALFHAAALATLAGPTLVTVSNVIQLLGAGLAIWACWDARSRAQTFGRSFWTLCGASYFLWLTAQVVWSYREFRFGTSPNGQYGYTDVMFFFSFAPFILLLLIEPSAKERGVDWQRTLDVVQVGVVILCAYLYVFYVPSRWETEEQTMRRMVSQIFVWRNVLIVGLLWLRTLIANSRRERSLFLTAAVCVSAYAGLTRMANYARLNWHSTTGSWFDLGWSMPFLLAAVIIARWKDSDEPAEALPNQSWRGSLSVHLTPMLMPALVLFLGSKIAKEQLEIAEIAVLVSFLCYSLRLWSTQRRQNQALLELSRAEERFRAVFSSNPQPSWVFDQSTLEFLEVNEAAVRRYGHSRDEFLRMKVTEIRPQEDVAPFLQRNLAVGAYCGEWRHKDRAGDVFEVQILAQPLELGGRSCTLVVAQDVTERKRLEAQLRQAQKMQAVGTLAGGIAHDFNNVLTIISGYSQVVLERTKADEQLTKEMRQIDGAAQRAAGLVRQLLAFSKQQVIQPQVMQLRPVVETVEKMLKPLLGDTTRLETRFEETLPPVRADAGQMEQVLVNLALNAKDAMAEGSDHVLSISLQSVDATAIDAPQLGLRAGAYVCMTVTDTGCGMEKAVQERIFEPFFTTKVGEGTGLGLSTVYGIVQQCEGSIAVQSAPGKGTTFRIYLPAVVEQAAQPQVRTPRRIASSAGETILVVEDDDGLRDLTVRILLRAGYKVYSAANHRDAEALCEKHGSEIDLLLTDVVMPEVGGKELADRLTTAYPRLTVLFMSGYTDEIVLKQGILEGSTNFVQKPFTPTSLAEKVRRVLDAAVSHS